MKRDENIDLLIPNFEKDEIIGYEISKLETFSFKGSGSNPFKRNYLVELREIGDRQYEVHYPESVLSASKVFNFLESYLMSLRGSQNSTIYVSVDMEDELGLVNYKEIQLNLKKLKKRLLEEVSEEGIIDKIRTTFNYLSSRERLERYFLED